MKKVLIVDDDDDIREILSMILSDEGYAVSCLNNGSEVYETVLQYNPDLILLDVQLGDADGRDICQRLKNDSLTKKLPVIIVSATHGWHTRHEKGCNADFYIAKPFDVNQIVEEVGRLAM